MCIFYDICFQSLFTWKFTFSHFSWLPLSSSSSSVSFISRLSHFNSPLCATVYSCAFASSLLHAQFLTLWLNSLTHSLCSFHPSHSFRHLYYVSLLCYCSKGHTNTRKYTCRYVERGRQKGRKCYYDSNFNISFFHVCVRTCTHVCIVIASHRCGHRLVVADAVACFFCLSTNQHYIQSPS